MKNSIIQKTATASLIALTLSSLGLGTLTAKASTVATVTSSQAARLYTRDGQLVMNRALAPNTPWRVGKIISLNDQTYYQVATNEYLKATDSKLSGDAANGKLAVGTIVNGDAQMYFTVTKGDAPAARTLANGTQWQVSYGVRDSNGATYYSVAPNEWVKADHITLNKAVKVIQINATFAGTTNENIQQPTNNNNTNTSTSDPNAPLTVTIVSGDAPVYTDATKGDPIVAKPLPQGSKWAVSRVVSGKNGTYYFQVAQHEWITGDHAQVSKTPDNVEFYPEFQLMKITN